MSELAVVVLSTDDEHRTVLQMQTDATGVAKTVQSFGAFPLLATDSAMRRIRDLQPAVLLVDIPRQSPGEGVRIIELLHTEASSSAIFAVGETSQAQIIISAMRAGAREFLDRPVSINLLLEAFVRLASSQRKVQASGERGKIFTFVNTRGGCGATTLAVNTAFHLQNTNGNTVLVDLAPLGHAALHMKVKATFTVSDALANLERLDRTLLEGYLTPGPDGLQMLAGVHDPSPQEYVNSDVARLFDILVGSFSYVIVDVSWRLDRLVKLVCDLSDSVLLVAQPDWTSLWGAAKVRQFLSDSTGTSRIRLVMNRWRKIHGLSDAEIESTTHLKILSRVPNHYPAASGAIDRGVPIVQENHTEIAGALTQLVGLLANKPIPKPRKSLFSFGA
jgi:pilus assembly protein CpaE